MKKILLSLLAVFTAFVCLATTYYSQGTGTFNTLTNWNTVRLGGGASPANFTTANDVFIVQGTGNGGTSPHSMTVTGAALTFGAGGKLWVEGGGILIASNAITINATGTFQLDAGATYRHSHSGAFTNLLTGIESFATTSNFYIDGASSPGTGPVKANVTGGKFGNFFFTTSSGTTMQCNGVFPDVAGNLTVAGSPEFRLAGSVPAGASFGTINIGGDLTISSGIFSFGNGSAFGNIDIKGDFNLSGTAIFKQVSTTASTCNVTFSKTGTQNFTKSAGSTIVALASSSRRIAFTVLSGSIFNIGANIINCTTNDNVDFTLNSGAGVVLGDPGGIVTQGTLAVTGNVQTSAASTRSFSTTADYTYNGTALQVTGTGLPASVHNLTVNNTSGGTTGVTLTNTSVTVNGGLFLTGGVFTTNGTDKIIIPTGISVNRSGGWVNGNLQKFINASGGASTILFEVGGINTGTYGYAPVSVIFSSITTGGDLIVKCADGDHSQYGTSTMSSTKRVNRNWNFTNLNTLVFSNYDITVNFDPLDIQSAANPLAFVMGRYDNGSNNWLFPSIATLTATSTQAISLNTFGTTGSSAFQVGELATTIITTGTISPTSYCAGASISVPFTASGAFVGGNVFTAQLSDATGVFAGSPPTIGTLTSTASGTIIAGPGIIPSATASGTGYRIRVVSSTPVGTGTNNGIDITVVNPTITLTSGSTTVCFSAGAQNANLPYTALSNAVNYSISGWSGGGFANVVNQPIPASPILIAVPAGVAINTYTATLSVNNGTCTGTATYPITVVVNAAPTLATVSQSGTACASSTATINLTGMVPNATGNTVNYTIGATPGSAINVSADAGGNASFTVPVILANNGATFTVVSITDGCTVAFGISFTPLVVTATPTITLGTNPSVCFSAAGQNANLPYSATTLSPTTYSISGWSGGGFANVTGAVLPGTPGPGTIVIAVPAGVASGIYTANLTVSNATCTSITYSINVTVNALPNITLGTFPNVVQGTTTAPLPYSAATGSPDTYSITYIAPAPANGFVDVPAFTGLPGSPIALTIPAAPVVNTYNANLFLNSSTTGCSSAAIPFTVTIYTPKTYYSQLSGSVNTLANWNTIRLGGGTTPANFTSGDIFIIQGTGNGGTSPHSMTTASAWTVSGAGSLIQIENGATLTATSLVVTPTFTIDNGGTYVHNVTSSASAGLATDIPGTVRNFGANSTVEIQKWANGGAGPVALPSAATLSGTLGWGNLKINVTTLGGSWQQSSTLTKVQGTLEIALTGGGTNEFRLANGAAYTLNIGGNLIVSGGILVGDGGAGTYTIHTTGNATFSGGIFVFGNSSTALPTLNFDGNFNISGGTMDNSGLTANSKVTTFNINVGTNMNVSAGTLNLGSTTGRVGTITLTGGDAFFTGTGIITHGNSTLILNATGNIAIGDALGGTSGMQSSSSGNMTVTCTGNFALSGVAAAGGIFQMQNSSSAGKTYTLTIGGNYNQAGGTFTAGSSSSPANIYFQNGTTPVTYTQSGGLITSSASNKNNYFVTNGKTLTLVSSINVLSGSVFTVDGGGILISGTDNTNNVLTGAGGFTLSTNAILRTANAAGIRGQVGAPTTGSIRTTGTNTFLSNATIEFNAPAVTGSAQTMGFANIAMSVPNNIDNIIINNTFATPTVSLDANMTVNSTLTLTAGKVPLGANNLFALALSGGNSTNYIVTDGTGSFKRPSTGAAVTYPVGPSTSLYNPLIITNTGTADNYSVKVASGAPTNLPSATTNYVQDTWTISEDVTGGSNLTVNTQWALSDEGGTFVRGVGLLMGRYISGTNWETNPATAAGGNPYTAPGSGFNTIGTAGVRFVLGTFPPPANVTLNQISAIGASSVTQGSVNNIIYNFQLSLDNTADATIDEIRVPTLGTYVTADIVNFQLWFNTSNNGPGSGATSIKTITAPATGLQAFTLLSQAIVKNTTGYFWVTADISGCSTIGNTVFVSPKLATANIILLTSGNLIDGLTTAVGGTKTITAGTSAITLAPTTTVAAGVIGTGSANNIIYDFNVTVANTGTSITQVIVPITMTAASDFTILQLWYGTTNSFAAATSIKSIAATGGGTETFGSFGTPPLFTVCATPVTGYFWVTADVAAGAVVNNTIRATPAIAYANLSFSSVASSGSVTTIAGGLQTIVVASAPANWFRSKASGDWTSTAIWEASGDAGATWNPATLAPTSASLNVAIRNTDVVTISTVGITPGIATAIAAGAKLIISGSGTFNTTGTVVTVNGTFENAVTNASPFTSNASTLIFTNTSIFNLTAASVSTSSSVSDNPQLPTANWNAGSTCKITGLVGGAGWDFGSNAGNGLQGVKQTFSNFIVDIPSFLGNFVLTFNGALSAPMFAVAGDFTVNNTGSGIGLQLTSSANQRDITISGNYVQNNASKVSIVQGTSNNVTRNINLAGNFTLNNTSVFNIVGASGGNATNVANLNIGGNLTMAATATLTKTSTGAATVASIGTLNFTSATPQTAVFGIVTNTNAGGGPSTGTFNMAVTGAGGVTLNSDLVAPGNLSLTAGNFLVPVTRTLILSPSSTNAPGGSTLAISLGKNLTIDGTVLNQGTFSTPWSAATDGTWSVSNGATYIHNTIGGISNPLTTSTLANNSNFIYRGGVPTVGLIPAISISGKTYGNLTFESYNGAVAMPGALGSSGAGTLTVNGNLSIGGIAGLGTVSYSLATAPGYTGDVNVAGNIGIVTGNTFTANTNNISLKGNWNNAGVFAAGTSTVIFNSTTAAQTYTQTGTGSFYSLTNSNTFGTPTVTLNNNAAVQEALTLNGTSILQLSNSNLTLLSTATKTARLNPVTTAATITYGTGQVFAQRYVPARRSWRLMAAPINPSAGTHTISQAWQEGQTDYTTDSLNVPINGGFATQITGGIIANGFDQSPNSNPSIKYYSGGSWLAPANTNVLSVNSKEGWMLFVRGDRKNYGVITNQYKTPTVTTLRPRGQLFIGQKSITSTGMTVIGNPYASSVDYNSMTRTGSGWPANPTYYVWDPYLGGTFGTGAFITLTWNSGTSTFDRSAPLTGTGTSTYDNRYIPSGAAIMVDFPPGGTLTFNETDKNAANTTTAFRPVRQQMMTVLNTVNPDNSTYVSDGALSLFGNDFNNTVDINDANKLTTFSENLGLRREGKVLSIERSKTVAEGDTVFYNISRMQAKKYQLQFVMNEIGASASTAAFLEDLYLKTKTPVSLHDTSSVDFSVTDAASAAADRFRLVFKRSVKFANLNAFVLNSDIAVNWEVADELNINHYEIERSSNGISFINIGSKLSNGNSESPVNYNLLDAGPQPGEYFYRIKSISNNAVVAYSDVVKVTIVKGSPDLYVFPNPASGNVIQLQMNGKPAGQYSIRLINSLGQPLLTNVINYAGGTVTHKIAPGKTLVSGMYQLEVTSPDKNTSVIKVMVNGQ